MTSLYKNLLQTSLNCETLSKQLEFFIDNRYELIKDLTPLDWQYNYYRGQIDSFKICLDMLNNEVIKKINLNS